MSEIKKEKRILGDEWKDWSGNSEDFKIINTGKSVFLIFTLFSIILYFVLSLIIIYLIGPRIDQWYYNMSKILFLLCSFAFFILFLLLFNIVIGSYLNVKPILSSKVTQRLMLFAGKSAIFISGLLGFNRDKVMNSFIKVNNKFIGYFNRNNIESKDILLLLPRCLQKNTLSKINEISDEYGIKKFVVPGGELARKRIKENQPKLIIAIACERDLFSGLMDVASTIPVIAIPNERKHGPCINTTIDTDILRDCIVRVNKS